jgi:hypothetical protein
MDNIHIGLGMDTSLRSTNPTADESKDGTEARPTAAYRTLEIGFRPRGPSLECDMSRIRIDVERTTSTM